MNSKSGISRHIAETAIVLKEIAHKEGVGALWRGVGATMVGVIPARAIYFSTYTKTKNYLMHDSGASKSGNQGHESPWVHLGAAITAGVVTATATNPIWMIKTRMQLIDTSASPDMAKPSNLQCIYSIIKQEGFRGLYKGMTASYLGVVEGTIQWLMYEKMKTSLKIWRASDEAQKSNPSKWGDLFGAAALSKLVAAVIAYPHEVIRTRLRELCPTTGNRKYTGIIQATRLIIKEEGVHSLYGGLSAHLMRVVPNSAIMFFCFEFLMHSYSNMHKNTLLSIREPSS